MSDDRKKKTILFLLVAVLALILIASALSQLELKPGISLPFFGGGSTSPQGGASTGLSISASTFFEVLLGIILIAGLVYWIAKTPHLTSWREMVRPSLWIVVLSLIVTALLFTLNGFAINTQTTGTEILPPDIPVNGPPLGPLPPMLNWLVWLGLAVVVASLGAWIISGRSRQNQASSLVTLEAEQALRELRAGQDFKNVIVRCYHQMSLALQKEQGIELQESMTAREFERLLEARGVPHGPVQELTRLFEAARYGYQDPTPGDEQKALACLESIVRFARAGRRTG
jgi:hypothetical protein